MCIPRVNYFYSFYIFVEMALIFFQTHNNILLVVIVIMTTHYIPSSSQKEETHRNVDNKMLS